MDTTRRLRARLLRGSWRDLLLLLVTAGLLLAGTTWAVLHLVRPAPPDAISITTGPPGSSFARAAERYADLLGRVGVNVRLRPSHGSLENLARLADPASDVEVGFVQVGLELPPPRPGEGRRPLVSLGTVAREPLYVLTRGDPPDRLSELSGKRLVVGAEGSGTRALVVPLLEASGITPGDGTTLVDLDDDLVRGALERNEVDAAFLMGDSASPRVIRRLIGHPSVHAVRLSQLDAILRRFQHLDRAVVPMGAFDLTTNSPSRELELVASSVEVLARADLHPAISDLLLEAMREVHGRPDLLQHGGEFPAAREHTVPLSADARRYYQSGKRWFYRVLPFWVATLADRFLVILVPLVLLLVPAFRVVPNLYRWRIRLRLYRVYGALLELERDVRGHPAGDRAALLGRLDAIEQRADALRLPVTFADQFYVLRDHIAQVRRRLTSLVGETSSP